MRRAVLALSLTCSLALAGAAAWWVTVRVEPKSATYDGAAVDTLTTPLKALTLLSCQGSVVTFTPEQCADVKKNGARFEVVGDFNKDGTTDIARVGVAELQSGGLVRVLLIGPKGRSKQHQIFKMPENGFSALYGEGPVTWYQCMACGNGAEIKWNAKKGRYFLDWGDDFR